ncbi:MAG: glycine cleavage system protein H [Geobacteraceae bacterium]|nr:glycine cleavage system protein H [Geobacteraceae bacterium]NTW78883.1 glycine cleavage system protein H [Geobacteraceae bacterium]
MDGFLEVTIDKFTFRVDQSCLYSSEGLWVRFDGGVAKLGLSDFLQQRSGDIAFIDIKPVGTILALDDEFASIETVKVNVMLASPVAGKIVRVNPALDMKPELINQAPFGDGWVCEVEADNPDAAKGLLLDADAYFIKMKSDAEEAL